MRREAAHFARIQRFFVRDDALVDSASIVVDAIVIVAPAAEVFALRDVSVGADVVIISVRAAIIST